MRKEKFITRTVTSTVAKVLLYNATTKETQEEEFALSGIIKNDTTICNKVQAILNQSERLSEKAVAVIETSLKEVFYAIEENKFIFNATAYDNRDAFMNATKTKKVEETTVE